MGQQESIPVGSTESVHQQAKQSGNSTKDFLVKRNNASERLGVELGTDLVIASLLENGCGKRAGLEVGMTVVKINDTPIQTVADSVQAVLQSGLNIKFTIKDIHFKIIKVVRQSMTERLGIELRSDLHIEAIHPGAASSTELAAGMKLVTINDILLRDEQHALEVLSSAGLILEFKVVAERQKEQKRSNQQSQQHPPESDLVFVIENHSKTEKLGVDLSPQMVIINLNEDTPAAISGLSVGMRIKKINNITVTTAAEMTLLLQSCSGRVTIAVDREPEGAAEMLLKPIVDVVSNLPLPFHAISDSVVQCLPTTLIKCDMMRTAEAESIPRSELSEFGGTIDIPVDDASPPPTHSSSKQGWEAPSPSEIVSTFSAT